MTNKLNKNCKQRTCDNRYNLLNKKEKTTHCYLTSIIQRVTQYRMRGVAEGIQLVSCSFFIFQELSLCLIALTGKWYIHDCYKSYFFSWLKFSRSTMYRIQKLEQFCSGQKGFSVFSVVMPYHWLIISSL